MVSFVATGGTTLQACPPSRSSRFIPLLGGAPLAVAVLLAGWGLIGTAAPVGWWTWLSKVLPDDAEAGGGLMVAVVQLAIALGATAGGVNYDRSGYQGTFALSAAALCASALLAWIGWRAARGSLRDEGAAPWATLPHAPSSALAV